MNSDSCKIVELPDDTGDVNSNDDKFYDCNDPDVPVRFKDSFLKNVKMYEKQLLEVAELDPQAIFELTPAQENEGDEQAMIMALEQQTIPLPEEEIEGSKILHLSKCMEPLEGYESGIFKKLMAKGTGKFPPADCIVTVHYNAYVEDFASGEVVSFDSSVLRGKTLSFMRGQNEVIPGFDIAVGSMRTSEQSEFVFSPDFAYGALGCPPRIPTNAYVYFKIELIEWIDSSDSEAFGKLPVSKQKEAAFSVVIAASKAEKRKGTSYYEKQNYIHAIKSYRMALNWMESRNYADEIEEKEGMKVLLALNLDLALVYLKVNHPRKTCIHCREALSIDPHNAKAFYRNGLALEKLGDHVMAMTKLLEAKRLCPNDPSISKAILELTEKIQKEKYVEQDLCRKMLGGLKLAPEKTVPVVSNDFKFSVESQLRQFLADGTRNQLMFPQAMASGERAHLEAEARRLNLKFSARPSMKGEDIYVVHKQ